MKRILLGLIAIVLFLGIYLFSSPLRSSAASAFKAKDPGVRLGAPSAGEPIDGLSLTPGKKTSKAKKALLKGLGRG